MRGHQDYDLPVYLHGIDYVKSQHLTIDYYQKWIKVHEDYKVNEIAKTINKLAYKPIISIILINSDGNNDWLNQALASIKNQFYPYWELYLMKMPQIMPEPINI
jgi:hypothetical protein